MNHCCLCGNELRKGQAAFPVKAYGYPAACSRCIRVIRDRARNGGSALVKGPWPYPSTLPNPSPKGL